MRWNRDAGLHTLAAQSLGKLPAPDTLTHPNNTAGCCCTMTEPLPERPNTARYTPPARSRRGGGGAGEEMTSNSCSFPPSLSPSVCVLVCVCAFVIPLSVWENSSDSALFPLIATQQRPPWEEHEHSSSESEAESTWGSHKHTEGNIFWSQCVCAHSQLIKHCHWSEPCFLKRRNHLFFCLSVSLHFEVNATCGAFYLVVMSIL